MTPHTTEVRNADSMIDLPQTPWAPQREEGIVKRTAEEALDINDTSWFLLESLLKDAVRHERF
jgi:uncharacterized protein YfaT (DUF1175 family)